jgi:rRNA-processing protein FCF1
MEVLLDSSFIISCLKRNIDFIDSLESQGFKIMVPREVLQELKDLKMKSKREDRVAIDLALEMFERRKVKKMSLGNDSVDSCLIKKGKEGYYIATLDGAIRRMVPNKIFIKNSGNDIEIERK